MDPLGWGCLIHNERMMPVKMKQKPAPPNLLKVVHCGCKTGCKTMTCSCRKHGLKCTDSCRECRGVSCLDCQDIDFDLFDK